MSQHSADAGANSNQAHPVKLAIAVTVGAAALIIGIIMLAYFAIGTHRVGGAEAKANTPDAIAKRIAPVVTIALDQSKAPPAATAPTAAKAPEVAVVAAAIPAAAPAGVAKAAAGRGEGTYTTACAACHTAGVAGAPKTGDKSAWAPRVAKGKPLLYDHAIKGFNAMPAKGGNATLADADVKAAVDYMVAKAK